MSKGFTQGFLNQIGNIKNSFIWSLTAVIVADDDDILDIVERKVIVAKNYRFECRDLIQAVKEWKATSPHDLKLLVGQYIMFICRALFVQLYEAFKGNPSRYKAVKDTNWFIFLANLRHSCAHGIDAIWKIKDYGSGQIFYERLSDGERFAIDEKWDGQRMRLEQIGGVDTVVDLVRRVEKEAQGRLNLEAQE